MGVTKRGLIWGSTNWRRRIHPHIILGLLTIPILQKMEMQAEHHSQMNLRVLLIPKEAIEGSFSRNLESVRTYSISRSLRYIYHSIYRVLIAGTSGTRS